MRFSLILLLVCLVMKRSLSSSLEVQCARCNMTWPSRGAIGGHTSSGFCKGAGVLGSARPRLSRGTGGSGAHDDMGGERDAIEDGGAAAGSFMDAGSVAPAGAGLSGAASMCYGDMESVAEAGTMTGPR